MCLIDVESSDIARQYTRVLQIFFVDGQDEMFDTDSEPAIRETWQAFLANPSTHDRRITAETLNGDHLQFLCSDILDLTFVETSQPEFGVLYPLRVRMFEVGGQLFYEILADHILGVLHD